MGGVERPEGHAGEPVFVRRSGPPDEEALRAVPAPPVEGTRKQGSGGGVLPQLRPNRREPETEGLASRQVGSLLWGVLPAEPGGCGAWFRDGIGTGKILLVPYVG